LGPACRRLPDLVESLDDFLWGNAPRHRDLVYLRLKAIALHVCMVGGRKHIKWMINFCGIYIERTDLTISKYCNKLTVNSFDCLLDGLDAPLTVHSNLQLHNLAMSIRTDFQACLHINMTHILLDACKVIIDKGENKELTAMVPGAGE
jgi:hypothetical protein